MTSPRFLRATFRALAGAVAFAIALGSSAPVRAVSTTVVISELRVRGPNGGSDEFIELYNLSAAPVAIGGWKILGSNNAAGTSTRATITAGTILDPGCHYLLTNSSTSGGPYSGSVAGDQTYATGITDDGGIALAMANDAIVDQVGLSAGSAYKEGTILASLGSSNLDRGYERKPGGASGSGTDTDSNASDFQLIAPSAPQNLASACGGSTPPPPPPPQFFLIHEIQGATGVSPLVGQSVATEGIVTARRFNNGFFIQTPPADVDGNAATSEGIFVFTSSAPPAAAAIGALVRVSGTVAEFVPPQDPASPPLTEIVTPTVTSLATGQPLPAAVTLTPAIVSPTGAIDGLERFEGMRVHVDVLDTVSPTDGSVQEASATATSNGVFYGVLRGVARPFREPGVPALESLPPLSPPGVPRFDTNPERIRIDSDGQIGAARIEVTSGATVSNLTGVLDFAFRTYTLLPDAPPAAAAAVTGNRTLAPVRAAASDEFTVGAANVERFFDTADGPGSDVVLTPAAFANRLQKVSRQIRDVMRSPDIIGFEEVENLAALQAIAQRVNADAVAGGAANPGYVAYLEEGNDPGGIDVGFLVKSTRVNVLEAAQFGKDTRFVDPRDGSLDTLNDRPPLLLRAEMLSPTHGSLAITVIVNHLRSLDGVNDPADEPGSNWTRVKRRTQAEFLATLIQSRQASGERVVSVGDYNAFEFSDGLVDIIGTIVGAPAAATEVVLSSLDLVDPNLVPLGTLAPAGERYSYVFDGNAQILDHVLATSNLFALATGLDYGRSNADFPESLRGDATRPERLSDHDPVVAYFQFLDQIAPVIGAIAATPDDLGPPNHKMIPVELTVTATDAVDTAPVCAIVSIVSNEAADGLGDGHTSKDAVITGQLTAAVRAERSGTGQGRIYTFTVSCADAAGNKSTATAEVRVRK